MLKFFADSNVNVVIHACILPFCACILIMFLYNLTLQRATGITHAVHGNFSGTKQQEIAVSRGKILELLRPDPNTGKVHTLLTVEIFGVIRSMMGFRLTGGSKGNQELCIYYSYGSCIL